MNRRLKCAGYFRLSKEDERHNDESSSISSQRMIVQSFAKFNNFGYMVLKLRKRHRKKLMKQML